MYSRDMFLSRKNLDILKYLLYFLKFTFPRMEGNLVLRNMSCINNQRLLTFIMHGDVRMAASASACLFRVVYKF